MACTWPGTDIQYLAYHDTEWGVPEFDSRALFEKLILDGFQAHNLLIEGYEEDLVLEVENGETATGSISLEPGRYILYCDIAGHREAGMEAQLLVE